MPSKAAQPPEPVEPRLPRRGRPLDASVEPAILQATVALLGERGFDRFTVQDIAERAGVGLGAIYRRWPAKLDVVVAAIRLLTDTRPAVITGDVEIDLARILEQQAKDLRGCIGAIIPGLLSAMHDHPDLAALVEQTSIGPRMAQIRSVLAPAFADPVELNVRAELADSLLLYRLLVSRDLPSRREIKEDLVPIILGRPRARASREGRGTGGPGGGVGRATSRHRGRPRADASPRFRD